MGWRVYGEAKPDESPLCEFFFWLFFIGFMVPFAYGWPLVTLGWMDNLTLYASSTICGILMGLRMAWLSARRKKARKRP